MSFRVLAGLWAPGLKQSLPLCSPAWQSCDGISAPNPFRLQWHNRPFRTGDMGHLWSLSLKESNLLQRNTTSGPLGSLMACLRSCCQSPDLLKSIWFLFLQARRLAPMGKDLCAHGGGDLCPSALHSIWFFLHSCLLGM
jgi:hypothetical protein